VRRVARIGRIAMTQQQNNEEMISQRCERGATIAQKLGLSAETAEAIQAQDEHWDGSGYPQRLKGQGVPLLSRIMAAAQHLDVFAPERTPSTTKGMNERRGRWFNPVLVDVATELDRAGKLGEDGLATDGTEIARQLVLALQPNNTDGVGPEEIDRICEAFAGVVDAKSPFTYHHSMGVADVATSIAMALHLAPDRVQLVRRAALLHDLGKLAVPNTILDKAGHLTPDEWVVVVQHPRLTREILSRIASFVEIAEVAGAHHEKLDGTGYPDQLTADQLSLEARIVAVADVYQAMIERRPYREGMSHSEAMKIMYRLAGPKLDPHCVAALALVRDPWTVWIPTSTAAAAPRRKAPTMDVLKPVGIRA
jgi:putative nucleotidyltransferase with HDIG domain